MHGHPLLSWQAPEYLKYKKTYKWYIIAGSIVLTITVYGILKQDYMLSVTTIIFAGVYFLLSRHTPSIIDHHITSLGIIKGKNFIPFSDIESFYIIHEPPYLKSVILNVHKRVPKDITIQLANVDSADVREILKNKNITELEGESESIVSIISRLLRL